MIQVRFADSVKFVYFFFLLLFNCPGCRLSALWLQCNAPNRYQPIHVRFIPSIAMNHFRHRKPTPIRPHAHTIRLTCIVTPLRVRLFNYELQTINEFDATRPTKVYVFSTNSTVWLSPLSAASVIDATHRRNMLVVPAVNGGCAACAAHVVHLCYRYFCSCVRRINQAEHKIV